jgi:hypothetical protein
MPTDAELDAIISRASDTAKAPAGGTAATAAAGPTADEKALAVADAKVAAPTALLAAAAPAAPAAAASSAAAAPNRLQSADITTGNFDAEQQAVSLRQIGGVQYVKPKKGATSMRDIAAAFQEAQQVHLNDCLIGDA